MMDKVRVQPSLLAITMIIMTAAAASFGTASGASYTVGEPRGSWDLRTNLTAWASTITFHPTDQLVFNYDASAHDVVEVTQAGYRACSAASPVSSALRTGNDSVLLNGDGPSRRRRYFICSTPGHCDAGMKMEVRVVVDDDDAECTNRLPPPGPAPPGAPSGITICPGSPPVVISTPGVVSYGGAAPRSSLAGLGTVVATVVMVSLMLGLAIV